MIGVVAWSPLTFKRQPAARWYRSNPPDDDHGNRLEGEVHRRHRDHDGVALRRSGLWSRPSTSGDTDPHTGSLNLIAFLLAPRTRRRSEG